MKDIKAEKLKQLVEKLYDKYAPEYDEEYQTAEGDAYLYGFKTAIELIVCHPMLFEDSELIYSQNFLDGI